MSMRKGRPSTYYKFINYNMYLDAWPAGSYSWTMKSKHSSQWAGQFAVAGELCKLGYEVAFTMGNATPLADLMVVSPAKQGFLIDVKGQVTPNVWLIKERKEVRADLFYVLVLVPPKKPNRYFVMSHAAAHELILQYKGSGVKYDPSFAGFNWTAAHPFEDRWDLLPQ